MSVVKYAKMPTGGGNSAIITAMAALTAIPLVAADISPNPHQVTRTVETDTDATLSDFANLGVLRKRGD